MGQSVSYQPPLCHSTHFARGNHAYPCLAANLGCSFHMSENKRTRGARHRSQRPTDRATKTGPAVKCRGRRSSRRDPREHRHPAETECAFYPIAADRVGQRPPGWRHDNDRQPTAHCSRHRRPHLSGAVDSRPQEWERGIADDYHSNLGL